MAFTAPTGVPGAGTQLQEQMMKVYQWRMNTKLEAESKDNRLQIAQQTIHSQNFELGQLRTQNETVSRSFMLKCEELAQVEQDLEVKTFHYDLLEKAIEIVASRIERQEIALDRAEELDETHTDAVVELTGKYVKLKAQLDCLEKARKQVNTDLQCAREMISGLRETLKKSEEQNKAKINCLEKLVLSKDEENGELEKKVSKANNKVDAKEREVDNFKALRHKELREKGNELQLAKEKMSQMEEALCKSKISEEENHAKIDNLKNLILCKDKENEELEKKVSKASDDARAKQQELDNHKALRHKELREKGEELQTSKKEISRLTEALGKLEEENNSKVDNLKKLIICKDREIEELEKTQQHMIQEQKELIEARSIDYDTELRKKNSLIQNLEAEVSRVNEAHKFAVGNLREQNENMADNMKKLLLDKEKEMEELKHRLELKKRVIRANDEADSKNREVGKVKTVRQKEAPTKKVEVTKPATKPRSYLAKDPVESSKRKLIDSDLTSDDEGKLFEDFFNKPKRTYPSKTPEKPRGRFFFKHNRAKPTL